MTVRLLFCDPDLLHKRSHFLTSIYFGANSYRVLFEIENIKTDSIIVLRRGCIGCARYYDSTSLSTEKGELIYVLSMHKGKSKIAFIDRYLIKERSVSLQTDF